MDNAVLNVIDLHTHFTTEAGVVKAVHGVDVVLRKGETLGLVGESGCGKSVTALSIMRLIPDPPGRIVKGRILFEKQNLLDLTEKRMRDLRGNRISMIFQEPMTSLNPVYRVGRQIVEAICLHERITRNAARERAQDLLAKVGIPDPTRRFREYPHQLSGGMRQRVMIAMALACNPTLLIADEPTTALDVTVQAQILELLDDLKQDFDGSILLITHDLGVVAEMAQRVAVMYTGRIVESAGVEALFANPVHPYTRGLMDSIPDIAAAIPIDRKLNAIAGMVPSLLDLPPGCAFHNRCAQADARCRSEAPPLIEVASNHWARCWSHV